MAALPPQPIMSDFDIIYIMRTILFLYERNWDAPGPWTQCWLTNTTYSIGGSLYLTKPTRNRLSASTTE